MRARILVVDDEELIRISVAEAIARRGHEVMSARNGREALEIIRQDSFDVIITDLVLPDADGIDILKASKAHPASPKVILITAYGTIENAVKAIKLGAYDYLTKPFDIDLLLLMVERILRCRELEMNNFYLQKELSERYGLGNIEGKSPKMREIFELIDTVANSKVTVLIQGESGTGKELIAKAIHFRSPRSSKPLIKVNCAALAETLLESEIFGHEKGSFTGAIRQKKGRFELADESSLFLDEIGDVPLQLQPKLLRVLQEQEFERVGGTETIKVDVRIICATNKNLKDEVSGGRFREDLFYRLNIFPISVPPLRERKEDLPLLADHFLSEFSAKHRKELIGFSSEAMEMILDYDYPGNVRELENLVERAVVLCADDKILPCHLPAELRGPAREIIEAEDNQLKLMPLQDAVSEFEKRYIANVLKESKGKKGEASKLLGISRKTLWEKLKSFRKD